MTSHRLPFFLATLFVLTPGTPSAFGGGNRGAGPRQMVGPSGRAKYAPRLQKPRYVPKVRAVPRPSANYRVVSPGQIKAPFKPNYSAAAKKSMQQMMKDPQAYTKKLAMAASLRRGSPTTSKVAPNVSHGYRTIKNTNAFKAATQAAKTGNWKKYQSMMGKVKSQGLVTTTPNRRAQSSKPNVVVPWSPFQPGGVPTIPGLSRSGQAGTPASGSVPTAKPTWGAGGNTKPVAPGGQASRPATTPSPSSTTPRKAPPGLRTPPSEPITENQVAPEAKPSRPAWHERAGKAVTAASTKPLWHDATGAGVPAMSAGPVWNEMTVSGTTSVVGPTWSDAAEVGAFGDAKAGPVWHDGSGASASAAGIGAATSSGGPLWHDATVNGDFTSVAGPKWLGGASEAVSGIGTSSATGGPQWGKAVGSGAGPQWLDSTAGAARGGGLSDQQTAAVSSLGQDKPALHQAIGASPGLKNIVEASLKQEEKKKAFLGRGKKKGKQTQTPEELAAELAEMREMAIVSALKAPHAAASARFERALETTEQAESIADTLEGYVSPQQTDPGKLSINLESSTRDPSEHRFEGPSVSERPVGGQGLNPEDLHLITKDGKRPAGYVPEGLGSLNPRLKVRPEPKPRKPYKLTKYDPDTGAPGDGMQREDGMIYSDSMGEWVGEEVYASEHKQQADEIARKEESLDKHQKDWEAYHEKNKEKTFSEELKEASDDLTVAKRKVELSSKVLALRKRAEKSRVLSEGQLQALENSLQKAIDRGATEEELKAITKKFVGIGQAEWEATAANREEGEAWAQLGVDVSHNLGHAAAFAGGFVAAPLGIALDVAMAYSESGGSVKKAGWMLAQNVLPVNAAAVVMDKENRSFSGFVLALVQDVGNVFELKGAMDGLKGMSKNVKKISTLATYTDNMSNDLVKVEARTDAFRYGRAKSKAKVNVLEEAVKSGDPKRIKAAVLDVQSNKHAMHILNDGKNAEVIGEFNSSMKKVYKDTDDVVQVGIAKRYGIDPDDVTVELPTNKKVGAGDVAPGKKGLAKNPDASAGMDRDVTYYYFPKDKKGNYLLDASGNKIRKEVPSKISGPMYDEAFYDAVNGPGSSKKLRQNLPDDQARKAFKENSHKYDQAITDSKHAEAYGGTQKDLEIAFNHHDQHFTDPEQIGKVYAHKGDHWYEQADDLFESAEELKKAHKYDQYMEKLAKAEGLMEEGMRQTSKQFNKQLMPRVEEINKRLKLAGKPPLKVPPRLEQAQNILKKVGTDGWSPAEAQYALHQLGYRNPRQVGHEMGSFMESFQKLDPTQGVTKRPVTPSFGLPKSAP